MKTATELQNVAGLMINLRMLVRVIKPPWLGCVLTQLASPALPAEACVSDFAPSNSVVFQSPGRCYRRARLGAKAQRRSEDVYV